jgi:DNA-binding NtrC family response regulator
VSETKSRHTVPASPVLVVESDFFLSGEIQGVLDEIGLNVQMAPTTDAACAMAGSQAFSLAILDPKAAGDDEARLARLLRERNPAIGLILLFPPEGLLRLGNPEPLAKAVHLPKPFRSHALRTAVLSVMGLDATDQPGTTIRG